MTEENKRSWIVMRDIPAGRLMPHIIPARTWYFDGDHGFALSGYYCPNHHEGLRTHSVRISEIERLVQQGYLTLENKPTIAFAEGAD